MKHNLPLGIVLMFLAELSFTTLWVCVKLSGSTIPIFEVMFFRGTITASIVGVLMLLKGVTFKIRNKNILLARCVTGFTAMSMSFYALTKIGMGNAVTLLHTSPIFVALLSPFLIRERTKRSIFFFIVAAFIGATLITKPDLGIFNNVSFLALLAGFFGAIAYMSIRHLHITEHAMTITFYFLLFVGIASTPIMIATYAPPTTIEWLALIGTGVFGAFAQLFMTYAYKYGPANIITPFNNMAIVFSFITGWLFWSETPDILTIIGAILIVVAVVAISILANRKVAYGEPPKISECRCQ